MARSIACSIELPTRAPIGLERIFERARVSQQRLAARLMHAVVGIPEPQIGLGQRRMQRLRGRDRHQTLLVRAAEENGDPHLCFRRSDSDRPLTLHDAIKRNPDPLDFPV